MYYIQRDSEDGGKVQISVQRGKRVFMGPVNHIYNDYSNLSKHKMIGK